MKKKKTQRDEEKNQRDGAKNIREIERKKIGKINQKHQIEREKRSDTRF